MTIDVGIYSYRQGESAFFSLRKMDLTHVPSSSLTSETCTELPMPGIYIGRTSLNGLTRALELRRGSMGPSA